MYRASKTTTSLTKPFLMDKWLDKILSNQKNSPFIKLETRTKAFKPTTRSCQQLPLSIVLQLPESKPKLAYETIYSFFPREKRLLKNNSPQSYENTFYSLSSPINPLPEKTVPPHSMKNTIYLTSSLNKSFAEAFNSKTVFITCYNDFNNTATIPTLSEQKGGLLCL